MQQPKKNAGTKSAIMLAPNFGSSASTFFISSRFHVNQVHRLLFLCACPFRSHV